MTNSSIYQEDPLKRLRLQGLLWALALLAISIISGVAGHISDNTILDAKKRLGGDVEILMNIEPPVRVDAFMIFNSKAFSRISDMQAPAMHDPDQRLIMLRAIDRVYPLYGSREFISDKTKNILARLPHSNIWGAAVEQSLLDQLGIKVGDHIQIGKADMVVNATIANVADRSTDNTPYIFVSKDAFNATELPPTNPPDFRYRVILPDNTSYKMWRQKLDDTFPHAKWKVTGWMELAPGSYVWCTVFLWLTWGIWILACGKLCMTAYSYYQMRKPV